MNELEDARWVPVPVVTDLPVHPGVDLGVAETVRGLDLGSPTPRMIGRHGPHQCAVLSEAAVTDRLEPDPLRAVPERATPAEEVSIIPATQRRGLPACLDDSGEARRFVRPER